MRVLVCGPRDWLDEEYVWYTLDTLVLPTITLLISGCADGVDAISVEWANERGIPVLPWPARWRKYKNAAGPIRNQVMIDKGRPDIGYAYRYADDTYYTTGTADMAKRLKKAGIKVRRLPE